MGKKDKDKARALRFGFKRMEDIVEVKAADEENQRTLPKKMNKGG